MKVGNMGGANGTLLSFFLGRLKDLEELGKFVGYCRTIVIALHFTQA